ncbi:hypothetical protein ACFOQM_03895 [Paenibacillus sp. GCM10012307]|uniref:Uncharacterized protein n=1 Tax=Paenibacillus roseus TaxID=2798579 RepID=A0A934J2M4_9BACL|nr:hypothetical protein [Paenibacillus roseus]MBJ6360454.1 hypothetical protein [Paenibacillus roseus]
MSGTFPSGKQQAASKAQSLADRNQASKEEANRLQSEADSSAVRKHGL